MTATAAADDPFPPFYIRAHLAPILEGDEVSVFQAPPLFSPEKSTPNSHGTHHAVDKLVEKFPFRPPDKCRHEQHPSTAATTPAEPDNVSTTAYKLSLPTAKPSPEPFDWKAIRQQIQKNIDDMDRWLAQTPQPQTTTTMPTTTTQHPDPRPTQTASPLPHPTPLLQLPE